MARKRFKPEEIVAKLRQVEVLQGQGMSAAVPIGPDIHFLASRPSCGSSCFFRSYACTTCFLRDVRPMTSRQCGCTCH